MTSPDGIVHAIATEVGSYLAVAACTWIGARVKRAVRDLNCYFARSRALEECIQSAASFDDFKQRVAAKIAEREKEINT